MKPLPPAGRAPDSSPCPAPLRAEKTSKRFYLPSRTARCTCGRRALHQHHPRPLKVGGGNKASPEEERSTDSFKVTQLLKREEGWERRHPNPRGSGEAAASQVGKTETSARILTKVMLLLLTKHPP